MLYFILIYPVLQLLYRLCVCHASIKFITYLLTFELTYLLLSVSVFSNTHLLVRLSVHNALNICLEMQVTVNSTRYATIEFFTYIIIIYLHNMQK